MKNCTKILAVARPKIAEEWHPIKNGDLTPWNITYGSSKKAWWKCPKGHEWQTSPNERTSKHTGCPYCSGRRTYSGNSLAVLNPVLARQWHPTKNCKAPYAVAPNSNGVAWWLCKKGHEWKACISSRNGGNNCPYCSGRKVCEDNCLSFVNPKLANEWNFDKNKELTPHDVTQNSNKKVWWKCEQGHEWLERVNNRSNNCNCPYCSRRIVNKDNCLSATRPEIAKDWHPSHNGKLSAFDVVAGSGKNVWWKCSKGHEWKTTVNSRSKGTGCPYCEGVTLHGNILCDSVPEAYMYLEYEKKGIRFRHNGTYGRAIGRCRYDFYLPEENRYIEVTSFSRANNHSFAQYFGYLRNIVSKRRFVEKVLGAKFEFIQFTPSKEQIAIVRAAEKV